MGGGRSGLRFDAGMALTADLARPIHLLLTREVERLRRVDGITLPHDLADWISDLGDVAAGAPMFVRDEPVEEEWLPLPEAADRLGVSPQYVRRCASSGAIRARKVGGRWQIATSATETQPRLVA